MYVDENNEKQKKILTLNVANVIITTLISIVFIYSEYTLDTLNNFEKKLFELEINLYELAYAYKAQIISKDKDIKEKLNDSINDTTIYLLQISKYKHKLTKQVLQDTNKVISLIKNLITISKTTLPTKDFRLIIKQIDHIIDNKLNSSLKTQIKIFQTLNLFILGVFIIYSFIQLFFLRYISSSFRTFSVHLTEDLKNILQLIQEISKETSYESLKYFNKRENEFESIAIALVEMKEELDISILSKKEREALLDSIGEYRFIIHPDDSVGNISEKMQMIFRLESRVDNIATIDSLLSFNKVTSMIKNNLLDDQQWSFRNPNIDLKLSAIPLSDKSILIVASEYIDKENDRFLQEKDRALVLIDNSGDILQYNSFFEKLLRIGKEDFISKKLSSLCSGIYCDSSVTIDSLNDLFLNKESKEVVLNPTNLVDKRYAQMNSYKIDENTYVILLKDITSFKLSEEHIHHLAFYDSLTGLANRTYFMEYLTKEIKRAKRNKDHFALLFIDIDDFKTINDTLGHNQGDKALSLVAQTLKKVLRGEDFVARLGGDEFCLIINNVLNINEILTRIIKDVNSIRITGLFVKISIGVAFYPDDAEESFSLIKAADTAMYAAKNSGKNTFAFHNQDLLTYVENAYLFEKKIVSALENNEFELYYQPQIKLSTYEIYGVEALIRWNDKEKGIVSPNDFISFAEKRGLINKITKWILTEASKQQVIWMRNGFNIKISVNITASFFQSPSFISDLKDITFKTGVNTQNIKLEITESEKSNIENMKVVQDTLTELGYQLVIDDFGTGYSSLSVLKNLNVQVLKIDKSFIDKCEDDKQTQSIIEAIVMIARALKIDVVLEGVEKEGQWKYLQKYKEAIIQGYYYSKPLNAQDILDYILNFNVGKKAVKR